MAGERYRFLLTDRAVLDGLPSLSLQTTYLVISLVLSVGCGLLILYLVWKKEYLQEPRHYLRCNLAVDDIIFTGCFLPIEICSLFSQDTSTDDLLCGIQQLMMSPSVVSMHGTYLLMAVELYFFICHPLSYHTKVTTKRVTIGIAAVKAFALFLGVGPVVIRRLQTSGDILSCDTGLRSGTVSAIFRIISLVGIVLAALVIFILYYLVYREARKQQERDENRNLWLYQTKAFKTLAPHVTVLAISGATTVFLIVAYRLSLNGEGEVPASLLRAAQAAKLIFLTVSSMANPIIYSFRQPEFRRALRQLCGLPAHGAVAPAPPPPVRRGQDMEMAIFCVPDHGQGASGGESTSASPPSEGEAQHGDQSPPNPAQAPTTEETHGPQAMRPKGHDQGMAETPSNPVVTQLQVEEAPLPNRWMSLPGRPMLLTVPAEVHRSASPPPRPGYHVQHHSGPPEQHNQEMENTTTPTPKVEINLKVISFYDEAVATKEKPRKTAWE